MKRFGSTVLLALVLAGCASGPEAPSAPPPPGVPPVAAVEIPVPPVRLPAAPISVPPPPPPDQCGAYELAWLVGRPRTEIPVPVQPSRRRVVCESCPRTLDFRPDRVTIEYNAGSGRVTKVSCG